MTVTITVTFNVAEGSKEKIGVWHILTNLKLKKNLKRDDYNPHLTKMPRTPKT
jgi:hypothetical protein